LSRLIGPIGIEHAIWDGVYDATVLRFYNEARTHRQRLFESAKEICTSIAAQGLAATVLIDGSFVTEKERPNDIDVWVFVEVANDHTSKNLLDPHWLNWLHDSATRVHQVDIYVHPCQNGMIVDKFADEEYNLVSVEWYIAQLGIWFASGRDDEPPKGAFLLKI
jgi:hypothetical protein